MDAVMSVWNSTRTTSHWSYAWPKCPHCDSDVTSLQQEAVRLDTTQGNYSLKYIAPSSYVLSPCGCIVEAIYQTVDADGNQCISFTPPVEVKMTPRLRKIREALGL